MAVFTLHQLATGLHPQEVMEQAQERAKERAEFLGGGVFGKAYAHPNRDDLCVKIGGNFGCGGPRRAGTDVMDSDGWLYWIRQTQKHPTIYAPRVISIDVYVNPEVMGLYYVAVMERLYSHRRPINGRTVDHFKLLKMVGARISMRDLEVTYKKLTTNPDVNVRNLGIALGNTWRERGADLHDGNWLLRKSPAGFTPVITDPAV